MLQDQQRQTIRNDQQTLLLAQGVLNFTVLYTCEIDIHRSSRNIVGTGSAVSNTKILIAFDDAIEWTRHFDTSYRLTSATPSFLKA